MRSTSNYFSEGGSEGTFGLDTTFVLFFLAMDLGQGLSADFGTILSAVTVALFVVLPYFLPYAGERPAFALWAIRRALVAVTAVAAGVVFENLTGSVVPASMASLPLTLCIVSAVISCHLQLFRAATPRLAK